MSMSNAGRKRKKVGEVEKLVPHSSCVVSSDGIVTVPDDTITTYNAFNDKIVVNKYQIVTDRLVRISGFNFAYDSKANSKLYFVCQKCRSRNLKARKQRRPRSFIGSILWDVNAGLFIGDVERPSAAPHFCQGPTTCVDENESNSQLPAPAFVSSETSSISGTKNVKSAISSLSGNQSQPLDSRQTGNFGSTEVATAIVNENPMRMSNTGRKRKKVDDDEKLVPHTSCTISSDGTVTVPDDTITMFNALHDKAVIKKYQIISNNIVKICGFNYCLDSKKGQKRYFVCQDCRSLKFKAARQGEPRSLIKSISWKDSLGFFFGDAETLTPASHFCQKAAKRIDEVDDNPSTVSQWDEPEAKKAKLTNKSPIENQSQHLTSVSRQAENFESMESAVLDESIIVDENVQVNRDNLSTLQSPQHQACTAPSEKTFKSFKASENGRKRKSYENEDDAMDVQMQQSDRKLVPNSSCIISEDMVVEVPKDLVEIYKSDRIVAKYQILGDEYVKIDEFVFGVSRRNGASRKYSCVDCESISGYARREKKPTIFLGQLYWDNSKCLLFGDPGNPSSQPHSCLTVNGFLSSGKTIDPPDENAEAFSIPFPLDYRSKKLILEYSEKKDIKLIPHQLCSMSPDGTVTVPQDVIDMCKNVHGTSVIPKFVKIDEKNVEIAGHRFVMCKNRKWSRTFQCEECQRLRNRHIYHKKPRIFLGSIQWDMVLGLFFGDAKNPSSHPHSCTTSKEHIDKQELHAAAVFSCNDENEVDAKMPERNSILLDSTEESQQFVTELSVESSVQLISYSNVPPNEGLLVSVPAAECAMIDENLGNNQGLFSNAFTSEVKHASTTSCSLISVPENVLEQYKNAFPSPVIPVFQFLKSGDVLISIYRYEKRRRLAQKIPYECVDCKLAADAIGCTSERYIYYDVKSNLFYGDTLNPSGKRHLCDMFPQFKRDATNDETVQDREKRWEEFSLPENTTNFSAESFIEELKKKNSIYASLRALQNTVKDVFAGEQPSANQVYILFTCRNGTIREMVESVFSVGRTEMPLLECLMEHKYTNSNLSEIFSTQQVWMAPLPLGILSENAAADLESLFQNYGYINKLDFERKKFCTEAIANVKNGTLSTLLIKIQEEDYFNVSFNQAIHAAMRMPFNFCSSTDV